MQDQTFVASRFTAGNRIFPTSIAINDRGVTRRKRSWFTVNEETIGIRNVASVHVASGLCWADVRIESSGGADPILSHGHWKGDARRLKELIATLQAS